MANGMLADMRQRLADVGFVDAPVATGRLPDTPDAVLALIEYESLPPLDFDATNLPVLERMSLQVIARVGKDAGIGAAEALAWDAYARLSGRHVEVTPASGITNRYDFIRANHTPAHVGYDDNDRPLVVVNFSLQRWGDMEVPT
jgi:hypothetical protein